MGAGDPLPLSREWDVWVSAPPVSKHAVPVLRRLGGFACVASMWRWLNNLPAPGRVAVGGVVYIFQRGVEPRWEHPENAAGGRWLYSIADDGLAAAAWQDLCLSLVGEVLDPAAEVVGIVLARRFHYTRLSVWTRDRRRADRNIAIGRAVKADLPGGVGLDYQDHGASFSGFRHTL